MAISNERGRVFRFRARIERIGINPFVFVPEPVLKKIFTASGKDKGPIPVCGTVNGIPFKQTLVRYRGHWRLYINAAMLKNSPKRIGEEITVTAAHDPVDRTVPLHPALEKALNRNLKARNVFHGLTPSRQKEINRYLHALKSKESLARNVERAVHFLTGKDRFVGRDKP